MDEKLTECKRLYGQRKPVYIKCQVRVAALLEDILVENHIPFHSIIGRVKEEASYLEKCKRYDKPLNKVKDMVGIRVIGRTKSEVSAICKAVRENFEVDNQILENREYKLGADKMGYLARNFIVYIDDDRAKLPEYRSFRKIPIEIQVRTLLQNAWAEVEYDRTHKYHGRIPQRCKKDFYLMAGELELMDNYLDELYQRIEVFNREGNTLGESDFVEAEGIADYLEREFSGIEFSKDVESSDFVEELFRYGIAERKDLDAMIRKGLEENLLEYSRKWSYLGVLRTIMITYDAERYFSQAFAGQWKVIDAKMEKLWFKYNKDIRAILNTNEIEVKNGE